MMKKMDIEPEIPEIYQTRDYAKFNILEWNRQVHLGHVVKLETSLKEQNLLSQNPILVDNNFNVLDGQHRLEAAKRLGIPVYYTVCTNPTTHLIPKLNANQKKWTTNDYLKYYKMSNMESYIELERFMEETGFTVTIALCWCTQSSHRVNNREFQNGTLKIDYHPRAREAALFVSSWIELMRKTKHVGHAVRSHLRFHEPVKRFFCTAGIDYNRFMTNFKRKPYEFVTHASPREYLKNIVRVYNHGYQHRVMITTDGYIKQVPAGVKVYD